MKCLVTALPLDLVFKTKGELAVGIVDDAVADGLVPDFVCGDEVYGSCTKLREHLERGKQAYVLRVPKNFRVTMGNGVTLTCEDAVKKLLKGKRSWESAPRERDRRATAGTRGRGSAPPHPVTPCLSVVT